MVKTRVLVVDDEDSIRNLLKSRLSRENFDVEVASSYNEATKILESRGRISVLITDLRMPGKDGFDLMKWTKERFPMIRMIVITGHGEKEVAIQALRLGASNYLEKPFDLEELSHSVKQAAREGDLELENRNLLARLEARVERVEGKQDERGWFESSSPAMTDVNNWIKVLRREAMRGEVEEPTVLILGESGTGKEGVARAIHSSSRRGRGSWVTVNCANFNEQLLDSELFGHEKGAFTGASQSKAGLFEIAKGGTLFLDEIGEMDPKLQAKLLRVLQEKTMRRVGGTEDISVDVRVIAATNRNLEKEMKAGRFRDDLFHRLNKVAIQLPTLREREDDILPMAIKFAEEAFRARGKKFSGFSKDAESALVSYPWPGNVRELLNVIERVALVWSGEGKVLPELLSLPKTHEDKRSKPPLVVVSGSNEGFTVLKKKWCDTFEQEYLSAILNRNQGNVSAAAREAKLDRSNFLRLLRRHRLTAKPFRKAA